MSTKHSSRLVVIFTIMVLLSLLPTSTLGQIPYPTVLGTTERVSIASDGTQGNDGSGFFSYAGDGVPITPDGRFVAFASAASNLVPNDTNNTVDVFVHDRLSKLTEIVSVTSAGEQGSTGSHSRSMTPDGRYIVFDSFSDFSPGDGAHNTNNDVFLRDRQTGQTIRVSSIPKDPSGVYSPWSETPVISADGRYVAFFSRYCNFVRPCNNDTRDIFVHDLDTGIFKMVSVSSEGEQGNNGSTLPSINADGRYIAFESQASNLVPGDTNTSMDIFIRDQEAGTTKRLSVSSDGNQGNDESRFPSISSDGRYVSFQSYASNLVPNDTNNSADIFVHDNLTGQTFRVSTTSDGSQADNGSGWNTISPDGVSIAFLSSASNLVPDDTNNKQDVFIHDISTGETFRVSISTDGIEGNNLSVLVSISANGRFISYASYANNLVPNDTNGVMDTFVHDRGWNTSVTPFIDLPFDYSSSTFVKESSDTEQGGKVNAYFDHEYPTFSNPPNSPNFPNTVNFYGYDSSQTNPPSPYKVVYNGHDGIDYKISSGTPVLAAASGTVTFADQISGYCWLTRKVETANVIKVQHNNGYITEYWHLSSIAPGVSPGAIVSRSLANPIGYSGNTGCSTGPHLHFTIRNPLGIVVDPYAWMPLPDAAWYGQIDPWKQYNFDNGALNSTSFYLWTHPLAVKTWLTDSAPTVITSTSGSTIATFPIGAFSVPLSVQMLEGLHSARISGFKSLYTFSLFGYTGEDIPVTIMDKDIILDIHQGEGSFQPLFDSGTITPTLQVWDAQLYTWQELPAAWDPSSSTIHATTSRIGTFALTMHVNQIYMPLTHKASP